MKVAFISDIHSNLFALKSVLAEIRDLGVESIYCLGDIIGYHSFPNEVIELVQDSKIISIKGNHDRDITDGRFDPESGADFIKRWTAEGLKPENAGFVRNLPDELDVTLGSCRLKLVHGSFFQNDEYLFEGSADAARSIEACDSDILLCAHTHLPYIRNYGSKMLINTGSVGKPKLGRPLASYILLDITEKEMPQAEIREVEYDYEAAAADLEKKNLPQKFADALRSGCA